MRFFIGIITFACFFCQSFWHTNNENHRLIRNTCFNGTVTHYICNPKGLICMKKKKLMIYIITQELFLYSLLAYCIVFFAEILKKESVSFFFDTTILLAIVFISGMLHVVTFQSIKKKEKQKSLHNIIIAFMLAMFSSGIIFLYTQHLDSGSMLTIGGGLTIFLLALLSLSENKENPRA